MRREPCVAGATVALAGVQVNVSINALTVTVDDAFTHECVVLPKFFIRPKAVSTDS